MYKTAHLHKKYIREKGGMHTKLLSVAVFNTFLDFGLYNTFLMFQNPVKTTVPFPRSSENDSSLHTSSTFLMSCSANLIAL